MTVRIPVRALTSSGIIDIGIFACSVFRICLGDWLGLLTAILARNFNTSSSAESLALPLILKPHGVVTCLPRVCKAPMILGLAAPCDGLTSALRRLPLCRQLQGHLRAEGVHRGAVQGRAPSPMQPLRRCGPPPLPLMRLRPRCLRQVHLHNNLSGWATFSNVALSAAIRRLEAVLRNASAQAPRTARH